MGLSYCLAVLLRSGGSPHRVGNSALKPLQTAIADRKPKCLSLLIAAGANPLEKRDCPSGFLAAERQDLLGLKHRPDTPGARVLRVLLQAEEFLAGSWQWPCAATANSLFDNEGKRRKRPRTERKGAHTLTASTRWMAPRRGVFLPSVLRSAECLISLLFTLLSQVLPPLVKSQYGFLVLYPAQASTAKVCHGVLMKETIAPLAPRKYEIHNFRRCWRRQ